jgi:hypothetical protein
MYIKVMEKETLNEKDGPGNYFYSNLTCFLKNSSHNTIYYISGYNNNIISMAYWCYKYNTGNHKRAYHN